ncbi:diacylglycerol kinase family protein [Deinococcus sp.]|uniref:diacylglycerol/lipid kinase family protein n=1 Tax=Deinococcus sp. TaxID=47478 RepID=UPI0025D7FA5F|nr:diacylglycerol kinase family protein [Deinococcus sp.]
MTSETTPPTVPTTAPTTVPTTVPTKQALLIFNPRSGRGDSSLPQFVAALGALGWMVEATELQPDTDLDALVAGGRHRVVIAAGGDGTVSALAYALRGTGTPLLAYPAGTANLIAQNLRLPEDPAQLAAVVEAGHSVRLDLGELEVAGERRGFVMTVGAGIDAAMIKGAEGLKDKLGAMAYVVSAMKQLNPQSTTFTLELDGERRQVEAMAVMVANFGMANFRLPIAAGVSPSDGLLSVLVLKPGSLLTLVPHLADSLRARLHLGEPVFSFLSTGPGRNTMETFTARQVTVKSAQPFPVQYDGEMHQETTPFTARILPGAACFLSALGVEELNT